MTLTLIARSIVAEIIQSALTVRVHSNIARYPWARLWYLCRAFDRSGVGHSELPVELIKELLGISQATLYRYMKDGREHGAFRRVKISEGVLDAWLGSLNVVCKNLGLKDFGTVGGLSLVKSWRRYAPSPPE